jgi:rhodanese-related sulfurtransferase
MQNISKQQLEERLKAGESLHLLDVREEHERAAFNIGGIHLPLGQILGMQIDSIEDLKDQEVICYCRSGVRSVQAGMMLESLGFTNVKNLEGGMNAWQ